MQFALSVDFMDAFSNLSGSEIKKASKTVMAIKNESAANGLRPHNINHPCGHIVSYSVNMDIRIIAYQSKSTITLLYINHHDNAYNWVAKRNFVCCPNDDIRIITTIQEDGIVPPVYDIIAQKSFPNKVKRDIGDDVIDKIQSFTNDDELFSYIESQPEELQDSLINIALSIYKANDCHISSKYNVKVITDDRILEEALKFPMERWRIFLHPRQENIILQPITSSSFITGAPGTGKSVCLVHKAKRFGDEIKNGECIIISTFKNTLQDYLLTMLKALKYNSETVFTEDISAINQIREKNDCITSYDGFFEFRDDKLMYIKNNRDYIVRHILLDEYQDFSKGRILAIKNMAEIVPFTISYDYSQSIYKQINRTISDYKYAGVSVFTLDYSYRINSFILRKLKRLMRIITMLSAEGILGGNVTDEEESLINNTNSAIEGSDILMLAYNSEDHLNRLIEKQYSMILSLYQKDEIIITRFFDDLPLKLQEQSTFRSDSVPSITRTSYAYIPTLKGKEYKAGIIILDDFLCQMLNINRLMFSRFEAQSVNSSGVSPSSCFSVSNSRFFYNILYVALSRFRDYVVVIFPEKYQEIVCPLLED